MKKKGDIVLPEGLKLILASLCLILLIYLAFQLYKILMVKSQIEQARETLNQVLGKVDYLKSEGKDGEVLKYMVTSPKDWHLFTYQDENSICFCHPGETFSQFITGNEKWIWEDSQSKEYWKARCKEKGVCKELTYDLKMDSRYINPEEKDKIVVTWGIRISKPIEIYISKEGDKFYIRLFNKGEYDNIIQEIKALDLNAVDVQQRISNLLINAKAQKNEDFVVVLDYKNGKPPVYIPNSEEVKRIIEEGNIVIPDDKENTAIYLIVGK